MKVEIDLDKCTRCGLCLCNTPNNFKVAEDGYLYTVVNDNAETKEIESIKDAIQSCPVDAITKEEC